MIERTRENLYYFISLSTSGFLVAPLAFRGYRTKFDCVAMQGAPCGAFCYLDGLGTVYFDECFAVASKNKNAAGIRFTHGVLIELIYA